MAFSREAFSYFFSLLISLVFCVLFLFFCYAVFFFFSNFILHSSDGVSLVDDSFSAIFVFFLVL